MTDEEVQSLVRHASEIQQRLVETRDELRNYRIATLLFAGLLILLIISRL